MEAFILTAANEDDDLYTFNMYALDSPVMVHMVHVLWGLMWITLPLGNYLCLLVLINPYEPYLCTKVYLTQRMQHVICGTSLIEMLHFQCRRCGFDPWSGN